MQEIKQMGDYCPECSALAAKGVWENGTHRYRHNGKHELTIECRPLPHSPAAPPEDAKALEDAIEQLTQDANFAEAIGQASDRAFAADLRTVINAARSREQYATKQIQIQTPRIKADAVREFCDAVDNKAQELMIQDGKVEGKHYAAMRLIAPKYLGDKWK